MLSKLIKYEFKNTYKSLLMLFVVVILTSCLSRLLGIVTKSYMFLKTLVGIVNVLNVIFIIGLPIIVFIMLIARYYRTMVKDEGYLTHTLPVSKNSLVLSKLIVTIIELILSVLVSISSLFVAFDIFNKIKPYAKEFINIINSYSKLIIPIYFTLLFIGIIFYILLIYTSISFGQRKKENKGLFSVIYGIVIYNVVQIASLVIAFIPMLWYPNFIELMNQEIPPASLLNTIFIISIVLNIIICIVLYKLNLRNLENKLNLE